MVLEPVLSQKLDRWESRRRDFVLLEKLAERHRTLTGFLETYTLDPVYDSVRQRPEDRDVVSVITVHSAKGTEAPVCYLLRAEPGVYPHARSLGDEDAEEEERRILYVAMTRARDELILTRTLDVGGRTTFFGGTRARHSPGGTAYFLDGVPGELVDSDLGDGADTDPWDDDVIDPW